MNPIDPVAVWNGIAVEQVCVFGEGLPREAMELMAIQSSRCGCVFTLRATPDPNGPWHVNQAALSWGNLDNLSKVPGMW